MRVTFREVKMQGWKTVKCDGGCGRRLVRQRLFLQTLNPFNKLPPHLGGDVKTEGDIEEELKRDIRRWEQVPETCIHCEKK